MEKRELITLTEKAIETKADKYADEENAKMEAIWKFLQEEANKGVWKARILLGSSINGKIIYFQDVFNICKKKDLCITKIDQNGIEITWKKINIFDVIRHYYWVISRK